MSGTLSSLRRWLEALAGRRWEPVLLFLLIAGLLLGATGRALLPGDGYEHGDGAVNALAIRDAMEGERLHGNYSRWGFSHPGPAFFYWQAGSEWLLHHVTHVAASPMAAHHFGMAVLHAGLLALALAQCPAFVRRALFIPLACVVGIVHLACVNASDSFSALLSTWPPHVLLTPFALFALAAGRLGSGDLRALPWTILGGSLLVHGHAAHALFVLPMFSVAAGLWVWHARRTPWAAAEDRRPLVLAGAILALFLLPLAIDLSAGSESNIAAILQQLGAPSETRRTWYKAVLYVFSFYGYLINQETYIQTLSDATADEFRRAAVPLAVWALVHAFLLFAWIRWRRDPAFARFRSGIALVITGAAMTFAWAKIQQGVLHNFNSFYIHGLALAAGWLALGIVVRWIPALGRGRVGMIVAWAALAMAGFVLRDRFVRKLEFMPEHRARFEATAARAEGADPVILSFSGDHWPEVASLLLALERADLEARVGGEWAFMFGRRHTVDLDLAPRSVWYIRPASEGAGDFSYMDRFAVSTKALRLDAAEETFGTGGRPFSLISVCGLADGRDARSADAYGMTTDRISWMRWRMPLPASSVHVSLDLGLRERPGGDLPQHVAISTPRRTLAEIVVSGPAHVEFTLAPADFDADGAVDVRIHVPDAWQPRALGASGDFRRFGLELKHMVVRRVDQGHSRK